MPRLTPASRFAAKIALGPLSLRHGAPGPCHLWTGAQTEKGYGSFWADGRTVKAHRYAYELYVGPIPAGLDVDHICRRRACVNPRHLRAVTHRDNILASTNHVARRAARTHCPAGHPYDDTHTYRAPNGTRKCRTCKAAAARARRAADREPQLATLHTLTITTPERQAA
jgi:hypothetical protein